MKWDEKPVLVTVMGEIMWCYRNLTLLAVLSSSHSLSAPARGYAFLVAGGTLLTSAPSVGFWLVVDEGTCPLQWWSPSLGCSFPPCSGGGGEGGGWRVGGTGGRGGAASWIQPSVHSSFCLESTRNFKNSFIIWALIEIFLKETQGMALHPLSPLLCKLNYFGFSCSQPDLRNICFA